MALRIHTEEIAHHRHPASSPQVWGEGQRERWRSADGQSAKGSRGIAWRVLEKPLYAAQSPSKRSSRHMGAANTYSNRDKQPRYEIQNSGRTCFFRQGPSRAVLSTPVFKLSCISYFELLHSRMRSCPGPGPCGFERQCSVSMTSLSNVPLAVPGAGSPDGYLGLPYRVPERQTEGIHNPEIRRNPGRETRMWETPFRKASSNLNDAHATGIGDGRGAGEGGEPEYSVVSTVTRNAKARRKRVRRGKMMRRMGRGAYILRLS